MAIADLSMDVSDQPRVPASSDDEGSPAAVSGFAEALPPEEPVAQASTVASWGEELRALRPVQALGRGESWQETFPEFVAKVVAAVKQHGVTAVSKETGFSLSTVHRWAVTSGLPIGGQKRRAKVNRTRKTNDNKVVDIKRKPVKARVVKARVVKARVVKARHVAVAEAPHKEKDVTLMASMIDFIGSSADDREISAMVIISGVLKSLAPDQRRSVATWFGMKLSRLLSE
jgi:hypothetical protein